MVGVVLWECLLVADSCEYFLPSDCLECRQCSSITGSTDSCTNDIKLCTFSATDTATDTDTDTATDTEVGVCVESSIDSNLGEWGCLYLWDLWDVLKRVGTRKTSDLGLCCAVQGD